MIRLTYKEVVYDLVDNLMITRGILRCHRSYIFITMACIAFKSILQLGLINKVVTNVTIV